MNTSILKGKKVLITAGPTREAIDPVRYISNHSSGKMGYAIADAFLQRGADVIMIAGPTNINMHHRRLKLAEVNAANEMYMACCRYFESIDIAVFAAAVADYRPEKIADQKIKKEGDSLILKMVKNTDIAYEFGKIKTAEQISVGFALETNDELNHAIEKLRKKNFDMVILNSMKDPNATFGFDTNKISIIKRNGLQKDFCLKNKTAVAKDIVSEVGLQLALRQLELIRDEEKELIFELV